jgi:hypothetical protein
VDFSADNSSDRKWFGEPNTEELELLRKPRLARRYPDWLKKAFEKTKEAIEKEREIARNRTIPISNADAMIAGEAVGPPPAFSFNLAAKAILAAVRWNGRKSRSP